MNKPLKIKNGILPSGIHYEDIERNPRALEEIDVNRFGFWTACHVIDRVYRDLGPYEILEVPTPLGTSYFHGSKWDSIRITDRLLDKYNVSPLTLANWLKDWNRTPLDVYVES